MQVQFSIFLTEHDLLSVACQSTNRIFERSRLFLFKTQEVILKPGVSQCKKICFHSTYITQKIRRLVPEREYIRTEYTSWHL